MTTRKSSKGCMATSFEVCTALARFHGQFWKGTRDWVCVLSGFKSPCPNPTLGAGTLKFYTRWTHLCCPKYLTLCTRKNLEMYLRGLAQVWSPRFLHHLCHTRQSHTCHQPHPSCAYLLQRSDFHTTIAQVPHLSDLTSQIHKLLGIANGHCSS